MSCLVAYEVSCDEGGEVDYMYLFACLVAVDETTVSSRETVHCSWCSSRSCLSSLAEIAHSHGRQKVVICYRGKDVKC